MIHCEPLVKHEPLIKHHETLKTLRNIMNYSSFDATILALDAEKSALDAEMSAIAWSCRLYRRGVFGDCGVGLTPQMCNRVTNHGDMGTFSKLAMDKAPLEFFFQEQSYSSLHSGRSLTWDHVRGDIDDLRSYCRFLRSYRRSLRRCRDP